MTIPQIRSSLLSAQDGLDELTLVEQKSLTPEARKRLSLLLTCRCVIGTALKLLDGQDAGVVHLGDKGGRGG